jgi:putative ABC transport system substrate-binding protein
MTIRRREFITLLGGAAAWPVTVRAQQPAMPVIGFLYAGSENMSGVNVAAFRKGLSETAFAEGRNVAIEFRFAENQRDRIPELLTDLIRRRVEVIVTMGGRSAHAAKAATTTIPIVFNATGDPVATGLVAGLNRPGTNATGLSSLGGELGAKRLELLHELVPKAARFAVLVNPMSRYAQSMIEETRAAAAVIGGQIEAFTADAAQEIDAAFVSLTQKHAEALVVGLSALFVSRRVQMTTLATHHRLPTIYALRNFVEAGGLMSYGASYTEQARQIGIYTGRILKGEKPTDLPVMQPTKFDLVISLQTAKTLGLTIPPTLLARADQVIE